MGHITRDLLFFMESCGFDAFELREGEDPHEALAAFEDFSEAYQASVARPIPLFRRRYGAEIQELSRRVSFILSAPDRARLTSSRVRAVRLLGEADIVFHDALIHPDTLALAARAQKVPVGKRCGRHSTAQHFINKRLADAARRYRVVVRLKGGDPMLFGRAHEEIAFLKDEKHRVTRSFLALPLRLRQPPSSAVSLTQRGLARSVVFATPRVGAGEPPSGWVKAVARGRYRGALHGGGRGRSG